VKFCFKLGKTFTETSDVATGLWGGLLSRTQCYEWYQRFKSRTTFIEDDPKSGQPSLSTGDDHIEKVPSVIPENRRLTVREVSEEVGICKSSCHNFDRKTEVASCCPKICAAFADRNKNNRVCQERLDRSNIGEKYRQVMKNGCTAKMLK